ncbi:MAG: M20 family metallo-hydrolase [Spirochaetes bacterium]|nr:M20 family metallo-hydrolase [Spirochaetota bacterium]
MKETLRNWLNGTVPQMVELQRILTAHPAIAPESGGSGEGKKAEALVQWLREHTPFTIETLPINDERVPERVRPNVLATLPGKDRSRAFWILTHLDVVPPGDLSQWITDPFVLEVKDGRLYGRGTEDNQQGMVSSIFAALSLYNLHMVPPLDVKLLFVSDEEVGSTYGIKALLREYPNLFGTEDCFLVPDGGSRDGSILEIAEKSLLWVKFMVEGKQVHASLPHLGKNAFLAGSDLVLRLYKELSTRYIEKDLIFDPPLSTFSPTKKEANVPNVNTIPGLDIFYFDCRVLPRYPLDDVLTTMDTVSREVERDYGVMVKREILQKNESAATPAISSLVKSLKTVLRDVRGIEGKEVGIGGNTVGVFLRQKGWDTVVWSTLDERAHTPNEYCIIENMVKDAEVMALLMLVTDL